MPDQVRHDSQLHSCHSKLHRPQLLPFGLRAGIQAERQHRACIPRIDHAVVQQQARGVEGVGLRLEHADDLVELGLRLRRVERYLAVATYFFLSSESDRQRAEQYPHQECEVEIQEGGDQGRGVAHAPKRGF